MAAPPQVTLKDLSGDWIMNSELSDDTDAVLALQGVSWFTRKALRWATVTLHVKQYTSDDGKTHIDIEQTATGGIKGTTELRALDWEERSHEDSIFGVVRGRNRWVNDLTTGESALGGPLDGFLTEGWEKEMEGYVQSFVINEERGWTAEQIWGFAIINARRYYTRRVVVKKGSETLMVRLVYDWQGTE